MPASLRSLLLAAVATGTLGACDTDPPEPATTGTYVSFAEGTVMPPLAFEDRTHPPSSEDLREDQQAALARIAENPAAFLAGGPPTAVLNEAELVFFAAGRLTELMGYYDDAVSGGDTRFRARLAWTLERSGLHSRAQRESARAVEERPNDAEAWFVRGFILGQADEATVPLLREIRDCYARAIELEPAFVGPSDVDAAALRTQIAEIDAALVGR